MTNRNWRRGGRRIAGARRAKGVSSSDGGGDGFADHGDLLYGVRELHPAVPDPYRARLGNHGGPVQHGRIAMHGGGGVRVVRHRPFDRPVSGTRPGRFHHRDECRGSCGPFYDPGGVAALCAVHRRRHGGGRRHAPARVGGHFELVHAQTRLGGFDRPFGFGRGRRDLIPRPRVRSLPRTDGASRF